MSSAVTSEHVAQLPEAHCSEAAQLAKGGERSAVVEAAFEELAAEGALPCGALAAAAKVGVEGGAAATGDNRADLMVLQKVGLGMQYPYWVTPFIEVQAGVGAARVELFERNDLAAIYTVGFDAGVQWALLKHLYFVGSVGWIRPYFAATGKTVYSDQATFRVGLGF